MKRRDWTDAVRVHEGQPCRVCGRGSYGDGIVHLAHVVPREFDWRRGERTHRMDALAVVSLCQNCHDRYDGRVYGKRLNLEPFLTQEEIGFALASRAGALAWWYIRGRAWLESEAAA